MRWTRQDCELTQALFLLVEVVEEVVVKGVHVGSERGRVVRLRRRLCGREVGDIPVEAVVDEPVGFRVLVPKLGHPGGEDGEDVDVLDGVVKGQVLVELERIIEKLVERQAAPVVAVCQSIDELVVVSKLAVKGGHPGRKVIPLAVRHV